MRVATGILLDAFYRQCRAHPQSLALSIGETQVTYGELGELAEGVRHQLDAVAGKSPVVGVAGTHDIPTYASLLAVLASGRAYVPLIPNSPPERNADIIRQTGIDTLLMSAPGGSLEDICRQRDLHVVATSRTTPRPFTPPADVSADSLAYVLFTSGSTGTPKGVPIRHRNLDRFSRAMEAEFGDLFSASDRFLQMFELSFDVSVMAFFYPLSIGASVHVVPPRARRTSFDVLNTVQSAKVTVATMVPSALSPLQNYQDELCFPDVRVSILTGEGLPARLARTWSACVPKARQFNLYGPTEATIWSGIYDYTDDLPALAEDRGVVSIGRPLDGFTFEVVNGELCLAGEQLADGYWRAPELTARSFRKLADQQTTCYFTGDLVQESSGRFFYHGRIDEQVQIGGHRVELGEIEHHARKILPAHGIAAIATAQADGFAQVVLCVEGPAIEITDLRAALRQALPGYMVPQRIVTLPQFPLSASGKIDKKQLRAIINEVD